VSANGDVCDVHWGSLQCGGRRQESIASTSFDEGRSAFDSTWESTSVTCSSCKAWLVAQSILRGDVTRSYVSADDIHLGLDTPTGPVG
jgi:hypothetical protein